MASFNTDSLFNRLLRIHIGLRLVGVFGHTMAVNTRVIKNGSLGISGSKDGT